MDFTENLCCSPSPAVGMGDAHPLGFPREKWEPLEDHIEGAQEPAHPWQEAPGKGCCRIQGCLAKSLYKQV